MGYREKGNATDLIDSENFARRHVCEICTDGQASGPDAHCYSFILAEVLTTRTSVMHVTCREPD
jgi:hypothetical protein